MGANEACVMCVYRIWVCATHMCITLSLLQKFSSSLCIHFPIVEKRCENWKWKRALWNGMIAVYEWTTQFTGKRKLYGKFVTQYVFRNPICFSKFPLHISHVQQLEHTNLYFFNNLKSIQLGIKNLNKAFYDL